MKDEKDGEMKDGEEKKKKRDDEKTRLVFKYFDCIKSKERECRVSLARSCRSVPVVHVP